MVYRIYVRNKIVEKGVRLGFPLSLSLSLLRIVVMKVEIECSHVKLDEEEDLFHRSDKRIEEEVDVSFHSRKQQVHF